MTFLLTTCSRFVLDYWCKLMCQLLENVTDFFDFVIDMTSFSPTTDLPLSWLKRTLQLCPPGLLPCVQVSHQVGL